MHPNGLFAGAALNQAGSLEAATRPSHSRRLPGRLTRDSVFRNSVIPYSVIPYSVIPYFFHRKNIIFTIFGLGAPGGPRESQKIKKKSTFFRPKN